MFKKSLLIFILFFALPVFADYDPMSDEPINNVEEFYKNIDDNNELQIKEDTIHNPNEILLTPSDAKPTKDYANIYQSLEVPKHSYLHNIDPDQYYDMKDVSWAPYPLLRLNSYIYFKEIAIQPGYYLLTPREYKDKWYLLFKQNGKVVHIIPIYERGITPELFYDKHLPKPKLTKAQKIHMEFLDFIGKLKSTKRKEPIKSYLEITDLENNFVSIVIYYGNHKYSTIFRTIKL